MSVLRFKSAVYRKTRLAFTLIELLVVITIMGILLSLVAIAGFGALKSAQRSACQTLIRALDAPLQAYKIDNGAFPAETNLTGPTYNPPTSPVDQNYVNASQTLYQNLAGKAGYATATLTGKPYMSFTFNQVGSPTSTTSSYIKDSFNYSIGYSTITPNNTGFYDAWSVGGPPSASSGTNAWLSNWQ